MPAYREQRRNTFPGVYKIDLNRMPYTMRSNLKKHSSVHKTHLSQSSAAVLLTTPLYFFSRKDMMPQTHLSVEGNSGENNYNVSSIESIIRLNYRDMGGDIC